MIAPRNWSVGRKSEVMIKINIHQAKTHLSRYIDLVAHGEVVVICRHNQPVAELRSVRTLPERPTRVAGLLKGQVSWEIDAFAPMSDGELDGFDPQGTTTPHPHKR